MGAFTYKENSIEGEIFIQNVSNYIRRNEEALANGLMFFSKNRQSQTKSSRLSLTLHHLYYICERIQSSSLGVDVGALNIKLDFPHHEPTFISFMANNARSSRQFDADTKSISSINSMKSIVSSASNYWRTVGFSKDPKVILKDLKYIYSSFTKIPCLTISPKTKMNSISGYEEYPCDTSVPVIMFKNLQVLELSDYEPNEIFGWHILASQLRILIVRNSKISDLGELIFNLVIDDESGRSTFNTQRKKHETSDDENSDNINNSIYNFDSSTHNYTTEFEIMSSRREGNQRSGTLNSTNSAPQKDYHVLPEEKWSFLKQLTVSDASITTIPKYIWKPLSNLVKLNLSNNLLESIPQGLEELVNLKYLNFADNLLTDLKNLPSNLKHLSTLNLNNNKLSSLEGFNNLCILEKVDLRKNKLRDMNSLKPIILQFIKNIDKFDNVYLANNPLPKNYRLELFNLFNGIKYKNEMKIDDSRPGYFESALLLDSESAFKKFEEFFGFKRQSRSSMSDKGILNSNHKQSKYGIDKENVENDYSKPPTLHPPKISDLSSSGSLINTESLSSQTFIKQSKIYTPQSSKLFHLQTSSSASVDTMENSNSISTPSFRSSLPLTNVTNVDQSKNKTSSAFQLKTDDLSPCTTNNNAASHVITPISVTTCMSTQI